MHTTTSVWRRILVTACWLTPAAAWVGGCGGDDDGGMGTASSFSFSSTLPTSVELGQLAHEQQATLCAELTSFASNVNVCGIEANCRRAGVMSASLGRPGSDADARALCTNAYQRCKEQLLPDAVPSIGCPSSISVLCAATVGDLAACVNALDSLFDAQLNATPECRTLTLTSLSQNGLVSADAEGGSALTSVPPSCRALTRQCSTQ